MPLLRKLKELPKLDMNPMVDMAFLLVCFFMMTTTFKTDTPVDVQIPDSHSDLKMPEKDLCVITMGHDGEVFIGVNNQFDRKEMLIFMGKQYEIPFAESEIHAFSFLSNIGSSIDVLSDSLKLSIDEVRAIKQNGISIEHSKKEVRDWIVAARLANPNVRFAIQADQELKFPKIHQLIRLLQDLNINRFNLITEKTTDDTTS